MSESSGFLDCSAFRTPAFIRRHLPRLGRFVTEQGLYYPTDSGSLQRAYETLFSNGSIGASRGCAALPHGPRASALLTTGSDWSHIIDNNNPNITKLSVVIIYRWFTGSKERSTMFQSMIVLASGMAGCASGRRGCSLGRRGGGVRRNRSRRFRTSSGGGRTPGRFGRRPIRTEPPVGPSGSSTAGSGNAPPLAPPERACRSGVPRAQQQRLPLHRCELRRSRASLSGERPIHALNRPRNSLAGFHG